MTQMALSGREREALMGVLRELDPTARELPKELRKSKRHGIWEWMWIKGTEKRAKLFRILAHDVSQGGVGFYARRLFVKGERFVLNLRYAEGGGRMCLCEVKFSQERTERHFEVGAKFVASVEDPEGDAAVPEEWRSDKR